MIQRRVYQISRNEMEGWDFKLQHSGEILQNSDYKEDLLNFALNYCRTHASVLVVLNDNNVIEDALSFDEDKFNPLKHYHHYDRYLR